MIKLATIRVMLLLALFCAYFIPVKAQSIDRLVIGESSDIDKLNPLTNFSATGSYINEYLFFSLLRTDKATGQYVPLLAEDLPGISADEKSYQYELHPMARFNSGKKIAPSDVVFSLKMVKNPFVQNSQKRSHYAVVASAKTEGDRGVRIELRQPSSQGLRVSSDFVVLAQEYFDPENAMEAVSFSDLEHPKTLSPEKVAILKLVAERINGFGSNEETFSNDAISGPYVLESWNGQQKVVLSANKKFWGKKIGTPNMYFEQEVSQLEFQIFHNEQEIRSAMFNGTVDLYTSLSPSMYYEMSDIPKLQSQYVFHSPPQNSYEYVGMNIRGATRGRSPVFADVAVRKAMAHFVNVEVLLEQVRFGLGQRLAAEYPSYRPGFRNEELPLIEYNPENGAEILANAGWEDANGNGLLDKTIGGKEVDFVVECIYNENKPERGKIAEQIQATARQAGVLVTIAALDWETYLARLKAGDFDLAIGAWVSDPNEDSYAQIWHSNNWKNGSNFVGFGDGESDALIEAYDATLDPDNRKSISFQIQKKMWNLQPYVFLWVNTHCIVVRREYAAEKIYNYRPGFWLGAWKR